jgi:hypothetical protein
MIIIIAIHSNYGIYDNSNNNYDNNNKNRNNDKNDNTHINDKRSSDHSYSLYLPSPQNQCYTIHCAVNFGAMYHQIILFSGFGL